MSLYGLLMPVSWFIAIGFLAWWVLGIDPIELFRLLV